MKKYYEDAKYNAAFERCVDIMTKMIQKYGGKVLEGQQNQSQTNNKIASKNVIIHKNSKAA